VSDPPAYAPAPGSLGTARAAWALKVCDRGLRGTPDGLSPAAATFLRALKRRIGRFKGSTRLSDGKWRWLLRIAADLGHEPWRETERALPPGEPDDA
jgi:hypothetical protein